MAHDHEHARGYRQPPVTGNHLLSNTFHFTSVFLLLNDALLFSNHAVQIRAHRPIKPPHV